MLGSNEQKWANVVTGIYLLTKPAGRLPYSCKKELNKRRRKKIRMITSEKRTT
jgi:hypothetical protein